MRLPCTLLRHPLNQFQEHGFQVRTAWRQGVELHPCQVHSLGNGRNPLLIRQPEFDIYPARRIFVYPMKLSKSRQSRLQVRREVAEAQADRNHPPHQFPHAALLQYFARFDKGHTVANLFDFREEVGVEKNSHPQAPQPFDDFTHFDSPDRVQR